MEINAPDNTNVIRILFILASFVFLNFVTLISHFVLGITLALCIDALYLA